MTQPERHWLDDGRHGPTPAETAAAIHRITAAPHNPEAEHAAEERAAQHAAESARAAQWIAANSPAGPTAQHTADTITSDALDQLYALLELAQDGAKGWQEECGNALRRAERAEAAWLSARQRAAVLSAELTRRAPLLGQYNDALAAALQRAEQAEAERDQLRSTLKTRRILHLAAEDDVTATAYRERRAQAAIERVRKAILIADDHDFTDWQRGYRSCANRAHDALDEPQEQP